MPASCSDLEKMGHKLSGFFSVKGSKQMEMVYCDFFPNQNGIRFFFFNFTRLNWSSNYFSIDRQTNEDRILWRQIGAGLFLRPAQFNIQHNWKSFWNDFRSDCNSVSIGGGERGKCHEFNFGNIHGTAAGNLFFLIHGTCGISRIIIWFNLFRSWSLFERGSNRGGLGWRVKHRRWTIKSVDRPVDAEIEFRRSGLCGDLWHVTRGVFVWQQLALHPFHGIHVAGGYCRVTLRILFRLSTKINGIGSNFYQEIEKGSQKFFFILWSIVWGNGYKNKTESKVHLENGLKNNTHNPRLRHSGWNRWTLRFAVGYSLPLDF